MITSITLPDDLTEQIDQQATREGVTRAEWIRNACTAVLTTPTTTKITTLEKTIEELRTEIFYHQADKAKLTTKCQELQKVINNHKSGDPTGDIVTEEIAKLELELHHQDKVIASQKDEIGWLRGEVAKLNDKIPMLPAPREHPWWMFWR